MGLSSPRADGRLWWTSSADSGNYLVDQIGRQVKCKWPVRSSVCSVSEIKNAAAALPAWQADRSLQVLPAGDGLQWVYFHPHTPSSCCLFFSHLLQISWNNVRHDRCDVLCQTQRDMSWANLPSVSYHIFSVAYVKDRRFSGGPGTSSSLFTSDLLLLSSLMTLASWNLFWTKVGHESQCFLGCCDFILDFCFHLLEFSLILKAFNPIFVGSKIFFPPVEKYRSPPSPPCMAFSFTEQSLFQMKWSIFL